MVFDLCAELSCNRHCCLWRIRSSDSQRNLSKVWHPALGFLGEERIKAGHWNSQTTLSFTDRCLSTKKPLGQFTSAMQNKRLANGAAMYGMTVVIQTASFWKHIPARVMFGFWHFHSGLAEVRCTTSRTVESGNAAPRQCHLPFQLGHSSLGTLPC